MPSKQADATAVAVIGAGPYGLSVTAHLRQVGLSVRIFGEPMSFWRDHMPKAMKLRSPWRATHLSSSDGALSLDAYAADHPIERNQPLPIEQFIAYGCWFQARAAADVDRRLVRRLEAASNGFRLELIDGEIVAANRVVIATGLLNQDYRPRPFRGLPPALVSHACEHTDFTPFRGKRVAVIGRGQSACECAAMLGEAGAGVEIISCGDIRWLGASKNAKGQQSAVQRIRDLMQSPSAVGPFPLNWAAEFPALVARLPLGLREHFTQRCLRPGAAAWLLPRLKNVRCNPGRQIIGARAVADAITIDLDNGSSTVDHALLGTGYRVDISKLEFLSAPLLEKIACADGSPVLFAGFESSVPKLHFIGSYAVKSFGPLLRFIAGASFAARSVTAAALPERGTASAANSRGPSLDKLAAQAIYRRNDDEVRAA